MTVPLIVVLTDFGEYDPFVGIMKGVISQTAPHAKLIDLTHQIPPGDIRRGAIVLWQSHQHFPKNTVFLTVVDPGVGTHRKPIYLKTKGQIFIGPDNGIFSYLLNEGSKAWVLENPEYQNTGISTTFHGRDIFAPAAAHAALGIPGSKFGNPVSNLVTLPQPRLEIEGRTLWGEVLTKDHFGNVLTSLGQFSTPDRDKFHLEPWMGTLSSLEMLKENVTIILPSGAKLAMVNTFDELEKGACGALVGSTGLVELVANQESAAKILGLKRGDNIKLMY